MTLTNKNVSETYLNSRIIIAATLKGPIGSLAESLAYYPGLEQLSRGGTLKYELGAGRGSDSFYRFEFARGYVALEIYSKHSPVYLMREALLRLLSMMAFTKGFYSFDVSSLFPYLVAALAGNQIGEEMRVCSTGNGERDGDANIVLSKRIIALRNENSELKSDYSALANETELLIARVIVAESAFTNSLERISEKYAIPIERLRKALDRIAALGYRVTRANGNLFELVKT
ncbi:MAG: hypothetical protein QXR29_02255 [Candidatus Micrarchaeaceae archaeon]